MHPERKGVDVPRLLDLARRLEEGRRVRRDLSGGAEEEDAGRLGLRLRGVLQEDAAVIAGLGDVFHGSVVHLKRFALGERTARCDPVVTYGFWVLTLPSSVRE